MIAYNRKIEKENIIIKILKLDKSRSEEELFKINLIKLRIIFSLIRQNLFYKGVAL
jgi:hypothetical protein